MSQEALMFGATKPTPRAVRVEKSGTANARTLLGTMTPGMRVLALTGGQHSLFDLIAAVLEQTGPAHVVIATWTAGVNDTEKAASVRDRGGMLSLRLLVDRSFVGRQPQYVARIREVYGDEAVRVTQLHAKFVTIRNDAWNVTIRTSMNLNQNRRVEQWELDDDVTIADWFGGIVEDVFAGSAGLDPDGSEVYRRFEATWGKSSRADDVKVGHVIPSDSAIVAAAGKMEISDPFAEG